MHQPRLPLPSSTGRCRSSNPDSTRLFAKFGPRRKKHIKGEGGWVGASRQLVLQNVVLAQNWLRNYSDGLFHHPLLISLQKWGSFGQTERRTRTERHLLAPSRAFYHRENLPASFICSANWATTNLGLTAGRGPWTDGIPFSRGSLASFALALLQRFESSIRGPFFAAADIALRFTALGPTRRPRPADAEGVKSLEILWCGEVS